MQLALFDQPPVATPKKITKAIVSKSKTNWIEWVYTKENPRPVLHKKQVINVRFRSGWDSTHTSESSKPFSYWVDDFNCFKWQDKYPLDDIVAYQLSDP
jgi:hypothetical protein